MEKITEFIRKCIDEKGYDESEVSLTNVRDINDIQNKTTQTIGILNTDKINYPMDMGVLTEYLRLFQSQYLVYTDGKRFHIFSAVDNQLNEISDIPNVEQAGISNEVADAKHLRNILWNFRITSQNLDFSNTILAMSIQTYREKKWEDIKTLTSPDLLVEIYNHVAEKYPLAVSDTIFQKEADGIINRMLRFEKVKFDGNALCTADVYRKIFCDSTYRIGPKHLIDIMTKFSKGKTAVSSSMQASFIINMSKSEKTVDYYGIVPLQETNIVRFMCRDENIFFNRWFIDGENYDSVLMLPPFGMRNYSEVQPGDSLFADRKVDLEYRLIENALNSLNDNGRLVTAVTAGFLFMERNKKLRDYIKSNFRISTIIELERPLDGMAINAFLLVIENKSMSDCLMSFDPVKRKDLGRLRKLLLEYGHDLSIIPDRFYAVPQIELTESWMPKEYNPRNVKLRDKLAHRVSLREIGRAHV